MNAGTVGPLVAGGFTPGQTVRLVFRVKTDRGYDDEDTYQRGFGSGTQGAALIDEVQVNGGPVHGFDGAGEIDNAIATPPSATWKSTGKPLASNWHWHNLEGGAPYTNLVYYDPCGNIGGQRLCNMRGNVISAGNHSLLEKLTGGYGSWDQEHQDFFISPTVNLASSGVGPGFYNEVGIDQEIADATRDIRVRFDIYPHGFDLVNSGGGIRVAWNFYPAQQGAVPPAVNPPAVTNAGVKVWAQRKRATFSSYTFRFGCFSFANPSGSNGKLDNLIRTSNPSGIPDSIRVVLERVAVCMRNTAAVIMCGPDQTDPAGGGYVDNIAIGFIDGAAPAALSMTPWDMLQDAFPADGLTADAAIGTPAFDRLTCLTKTGFNQSSPVGSLTRPVIAGDSMIVSAPGSDIRLDLVFRVYPGPGNYATIGNPASGILRTPGGGIVAGEGDGSWFGTLMNDVGLFGTYKGAGPNAAGGGPYRMRDVNGGVTPPHRWDPNVWISVRMDTLERVTNDASVVTGSYMSTIHERDYGAATPDSDPDFGRRTALAVDEGVKILPNDLFTPGTHIEYFFRRTLVGNLVDYTMMPDTTLIFPQPAFGSGNWDGIRFATWDALPDRWKDPAFGGSGNCMLIANYGQRRGDLVMWDNMARAIGLTRTADWGAGHGFYSSYSRYVGGRFPESIDDPHVTPPYSGGVVSANLGHEGTIYDVYDVVAGETNVPAGRLGNRDALGGCPTPTGPTRKMLRNFYQSLIVLAADLGPGLFGPFDDQTDDDAGLITDFITNPTPGNLRLAIVVGMNAGTGLEGEAGTRNLLTNQFGALIKTDDYRSDSGSMEDIPDLLTAGSPVITTGAIYGVYSPCTSALDAFSVNPVVPGASVVASYENTGLNDPWPAGIYVPEDFYNGRRAKTLLLGWTLGVFGGADGDDLGGQGSRMTTTRIGMFLMWLNMLGNIAGGCMAFHGAPIGIGDFPGQDGEPFASFLALRSQNPVRSGTATIAFGVERTERVEVSIYDVGGRRVRKLADRVFIGGTPHELTWDGADDGGRRAAPGVYFYQVRSASFTSQRKLTILDR